MPAASTIKPEEREFVVDSGASKHMVSRKDLNSAEVETMRISKNPTTVMTANGEVQTREEATVYVKELDLFVTVMHWQFFYSENSAKITGTVTTGPVVRNRPVIPLGAMVEYHPVSVTDLSRLHQFGPKVLPDIFLGYALHAGRIWKGDVMIADIEELEEMDASEIYAKRLNAKELLTLMSGEKFFLTIADGHSQTFWRRSGPEKIHLNLGSPRLRRRTR